MERNITENWLESKGFIRENDFYTLEKGDTVFGYDFKDGYFWIDGEEIYAMKNTRKESEINDVCFVCGFDLNFRPIDNLKYFEKKNIERDWLVWEGFVLDDKGKWNRDFGSTRMTYNFKKKHLSILTKDKKEGFEGKVDNEELFRKIKYYIFE